MLYVERLRDGEIDAAAWDAMVLASPGGGHPFQTFVWGEFKRGQHWAPLRLVLRDDARPDHVKGTAQLFFRAIPLTTGKLAYCPKGPWVDWADGEAVSTMLGGMAHFARRNGAYLLKVEAEVPAGPGAPDQTPSNLEDVSRRMISLVRRLRATKNGEAPHAARTPSEDDLKRTEDARALLLAVRAQGEHDAWKPGRTAFATLGFVKSLWTQHHRTTMVIDLDRSPDEMLARMKSKWRYNINLAKRKGVTVVHDNGREALDILFEMHAHTAERDGFQMRPRAYFEESWGAMIQAGYADLFLAMHEGRPMAAVLAYRFGHKAWYQVGASFTEGRNLMPAHALQFHVMQWAYEHGADYYDLVAIPSLETIGPDDPMWGLYTFKSGFGGRPAEWIGSMDLVLDPRGRAWEFIEPAYFRLFRLARRKAGDFLY